MDLYILKHENRIKVGRSKNAEIRIKGILSSAGILDSEIYSKIFQWSGHYERKLLNILKEQKINGEWFYYQGIAKEFFDFIVCRSHFDDFELKLFLTSYFTKEDNELEQKMAEIFEEIEKQKKHITISKGCYKSYNMTGSIKYLSIKILNMFKAGELCYLDSQTFRFFYNDRQYIWYFPDEELKLVKSLLYKLEIEYRYIF